jgi:hypothetical protein
MGLSRPSAYFPLTRRKKDVDARGQSLRSVHKLGCKRGHDDAEAIPSHREMQQPLGRHRLKWRARSVTAAS